MSSAALAQYSRELRDYTLLKWNQARNDAEQKSRGYGTTETKKPAQGSTDSLEKSTSSSKETSDNSGSNMAKLAEPKSSTRPETGTHNDAPESSAQ